jgi:hypothetical protein
VKRSRPVSLVLALAVLSCGGDSVSEPEAPATQRVELHFTGVAWSHGEPVPGVVVEYRVAPCPYFEDCGWRTVSTLTDEQGRYSITAARTCCLGRDLSYCESLPRDTVRSDRLSAYLPLSPSERCSGLPTYGPGSIYGPNRLLCTEVAQDELDFDIDCSQGPPEVWVYPAVSEIESLRTALRDGA